MTSTSSWSLVSDPTMSRESSAAGASAADALDTNDVVFPVNGFDVKRLRGATVVIPAVSLGNVPQLAADLLVSSLKLSRVAFVGRGDTVAPFAGSGPDGLVTGGLELYGGDHNTFVLLQRAPTLKAKKDAHVELTTAFVRNTGVGLALLLASLDAANQDDAQLLTPYQAVLPPTPAANPALERLALLPPLRLHLESGVVPQPLAGAAGAGTYPPFLPGAGLTRRLLGALANAGVPSGALAAWVVEGDNRGDAHGVAQATLHMLGLESTQLVEPASWGGLFGGGEGWGGGSGLDAEIYG